MSETRAAPYPPDTRAKGWRFEIDYEQIEQSETWPIAAEVPMAQHALLMMWLVAWSKQKPCGSFPNDENSIRAACRIPPTIWAKCREVLMRGWWLADDGRLYHDTLVRRVVEMMARRRSDSDRQAAKRAREAAEAAVRHGGVTRDTPVTSVEVRPESSTDNRPPTTEEEQKETAPRKRAASTPAIPKPDDVDEQTWTDWVQLRRGKKAAVSVTAVAEARKEAGKAGLTLERFLAVWCARGSQGLEASWLKPSEVGHRGTGLTTFADKARERMDALTGRTPTPAIKHMGDVDVADQLGH